MPTWVKEKKLESSVFATECIPASNKYTHDRKVVVSRSREKLAIQLHNKVEVMDKALQNRQYLKEKPTNSFSFQNISETCILETLKKTEPDKIRYEKFNNTKHLCVSISLDKHQMKKLFDQILEQCPADIGPKDKQLLFERFKSEQTNSTLE